MVAASLWALLVVGTVSGQSGAFDLEGIEVRAETLDPRGFLLQGRDPGANEWEVGLGMATLEARDRARLPGALYGDQARVEAHFRIGAARYRILLEKPGFLPRRAGGRGDKPPPHEVGGGVMTNTWIHGPSGLGEVLRPSALAAVVVWGIGRLERDGVLLSDQVLIEAAALAWGYHADDETHRVLTAARQGDAELYVRVSRIPLEKESRGWLEISFDDVAVSLDGRALPNLDALSAAVVSPRALEGSGVVAGGGAPGTQLFTEEQLQQRQRGSSPADRSFAAGTTERGPSDEVVSEPGSAAANDPARAQASLPPAGEDGDPVDVGEGPADETLFGAATGATAGSPPEDLIGQPVPRPDPSADDRSSPPRQEGPVRSEPTTALADSNTGASNLPPSGPFDTEVRTGVPGAPPGTTPSIAGNAPNPYASPQGFAGAPPPLPSPTAATGGSVLTQTPGFVSAPASGELLGRTGALPPPTPSAPFSTTAAAPTVTGFGPAPLQAGAAQTATEAAAPAGTDLSGTLFTQAPPGSVSGAASSPFFVTGAPSVTGFGGSGLEPAELGAAATLPNALGLAGSATTGAQPTPGMLAAIGAPTATGFASPGLPGTPQPANAVPASPIPRPEVALNSQPAFGAPIPATPAPLNAAPAPLLPGTPAPLNAAPANTVPGAVPGSLGASPLPGQLTPPTFTAPAAVPTSR